MNWLIARLKEPSSIRGLVWLLTVAGISLRPDQVEAIVVAGMALAGLLGVFLSDEKPVEKPPIRLVSVADRIRDLPDFCSDTNRVSDRDSVRPVRMSAAAMPAERESQTGTNESPGFNDR
jgi:hypothetical protein